MITQDMLNALLAEANDSDEAENNGITGRVISPDCLEIFINIRTIGVEQANKAFVGICDLSANADQHIILNVGGCPFLSSFIVGQLVNMATERKKRGFRLAIVEASEMILEMFTLTSMSSVVEIYATTEEAMKQFKNGN